MKERVKLAKLIKRTLLMFSMVLGPAMPSVAGTSTGFVTKLHVHEGNPDVAIFRAGVPSGQPNCVGNAVPGEWAVSLQKASGRGIYALLLTAQTAGKQVYVKGKNTCTAFSDREDPYTVYIVD